MGITNPVIGRGGISFSGDLKTIYNVNLWSRTGIRLLVQLAKFKCGDRDQLYQQTRNLDWSEHLTPRLTFSIDGFVKNNLNFRHSQFALQVTKDAIVDNLRDRFNSRPDVSLKNPDVRLNLYINGLDCRIYLDSSDYPLYKRGYRRVIHKASLNEALAAGLIYLSGWDKTTPFYDPMCGSGTLPIEAAMIAMNRAPGILRQRFGFHGWMNFNQTVWKKTVAEAEQMETGEVPDYIFGSDNRNDSIALAVKNAGYANLSDTISFKTEDISRFKPAEGKGTVLMNPPYGERMGEKKELAPLYRQFGDILKQNCGGKTAGVFTGDRELGKSIGLKPSARIPLKNGQIDCRFLKFDLYEGTKKTR